MIMNKIKPVSYLVGLLFVSGLMYGCTASSTQQSRKASSNYTNSALASPPGSVEDVIIVDCLLPGQVRKLGNMTYMTPRRPIKTSAMECQIRGGEYVAYDRSNWATALAVWMEKALEGDHNAQNHVGEIYLKGIGGAPQYSLAAHWFKKAAQKGARRAQMNLGYLHEKGLGVPKDIDEAMGWYRKANGLNAALLKGSLHPAETGQRQEIEALKKTIQERERQIRQLGEDLQQVRKQSEQRRKELEQGAERFQKQNRQLKQLKDELQKKKYRDSKAEQAEIMRLEERIRVQAASLAQQRKETEQLKIEVVRLDREAESYRVKIDSFRKDSAKDGYLSIKLRKEQFIKDISLKTGKYYALVIGNNDYTHLPDLDTAINDAKVIANILRSQYGFETRLIVNATRYDIYTALDEFRKKLTEEENFLIYYAGHGELDTTNKRGYWMPVDAVPDSHLNSIPNYTITDILNIMSVKQALIIADTCYSGIMTRSAVSTWEMAGMSDKKRLEWLKSMIQDRSRTVLTSGGLKPVLDSGGGKHSIFAKALIGILDNNSDVMEAGSLHRKVGEIVSHLSKKIGYEQVPQYAANLHAGHVAGDFLFVPQLVQ